MELKFNSVEELIEFISGKSRKEMFNEDINC